MVPRKLTLVCIFIKSAELCYCDKRYGNIVLNKRKIFYELTPRLTSILENGQSKEYDFVQNALTLATLKH